MSDIFGGGDAQTVETKTNADPWIGVQPYLLDLFKRSDDLTRRPSFAYAPSTFTTQAQQLIAGRVADPNSAVGMAPQVLADTIAGKYLTPDSNPYLREHMQDALGLAGSTFAKQYGGQAGSNLSNSGYQEGLARTLGTVATNAYADQYSRERQNQLNAMQLAPSVGLADANALAGMGAANEERARLQYSSPWEDLKNYQQAIAGSFGGSSTSQQPFFSNPMANAMGMGLGALGIYNGLGSAGLIGGGSGLAGMGGSLFGSAGMGDLAMLALA